MEREYLFGSRMVKFFSMISALNRSAKKLILKSGIRLPYLFQSTVQLLNFGQWLRSAGLEDSPHFADRFNPYADLQKRVIQDDSIDYLEFGVFTGKSFRRWTELNRSPKSRFFGFDYF